MTDDFGFAGGSVGLGDLNTSLQTGNKQMSVLIEAVRALAPVTGSAVVYDAAQSLTAAEMNQAAANLGRAAAWVDAASAATVDLGAIASENVRITGTTTITSFGTAPAGVHRTLRYVGALTLTYNATSMILPGAASILTAADWTCEAVSLGSGNWIVVEAAPSPIISYTPTLGTLAGSFGSPAPTASGYYFRYGKRIFLTITVAFSSGYTGGTASGVTYTTPTNAAVIVPVFGKDYAKDGRLIQGIITTSGNGYIIGGVTNSGNDVVSSSLIMVFSGWYWEA